MCDTRPTLKFINIAGNSSTDLLNKYDEFICQSLQTRLKTAKIVTLEIEVSKTEHPWMKFAVMFYYFL
ncbi:hypothetical protein ACWATR_25770 [Nostoc sp. UIC 10890]